MRTALQIGLLTAFFAGGYFALRAIPGSSCNFLHYEQTVVTADGMQYCGSGATYFVDLGKLPFPVTVKLTPDHAPEKGVESHYTLTLGTTSGGTLRPSELAVTQTRKLHLLLVDQNLEDYQHIHPEPVGDSGDWTFAFTPHAGGVYHAYAQFIPSLSMREMIGETLLTVKGDDIPAVHRGLASFKDGDYIYSLTASEDPLALGTNETLTFSVQRADGGKVQLQPVMGTLAHLVAFDPARIGVAHLHPSLMGNETNPTHPEISFVINFPEPAHYRVWCQVKLDDRERYVPFDIQVEKSG